MSSQGRTEKYTETRVRILEATKCLMESEDGSAVRMADIARAAGLSRQAIYLHFERRADLLRATTEYIDDQCDLGERLAQSRAARTGEERLRFFIRAWGGYLPEIQGVARGLLAMRAHDAEADAVWSARMSDVRDGCAAAVRALAADGRLAPAWTVVAATDLLWTILSFESWEKLTSVCGWTQSEYLKRIEAQAVRIFVGDV